MTAQRNVSSWLPNLLGPLELQVDGAAADVPRRSTVNIIGATVTDDPDNERTDIEFTGQKASQAISALDIDWSLGGVFTKTLAAGANTFTFSNDADGMLVVVIVTGAASTLTWPTVQWAGGTPPTQTSSGTDVYTFVKAGSTIYGSVVQDMS